MTLDPISIATAGYVCGAVPDDVSIALDGYVCFAEAVAVEEIGGGSFGVTRKQPHGVVIPPFRLPGTVPLDSVDEDVELAILAVMIIENYY